MSALDELLLKKYHESVVDPSAHTEDAPVGDEAIESESASVSSSAELDSAGQEEITALPEDVVEAEDDLVDTDEDVVDADEDVVDAEGDVVDAEIYVMEEELAVAQDEDVPKSSASNQASEPSDAQDEPADVVAALAVPQDLETTDHQAEAESAEKPIRFKPDWEVDRFLWPAICGEVEDVVKQELTAAVACIEEQCKQRGMNVVAVTSSHSGTGATTITLCLAREAARNGLRVALVDLNHSNPTVMDRLGVDFETGTESLQNVDVTPEGICVTEIENGVSFFPTVTTIDLEYCVGQDVKQLIEVASRHHDLVLIDASQEVAQLISEHQAFGPYGTIVVTDPSAAGEVVPAAFQDDLTLGIIQNFAA